MTPKSIFLLDGLGALVSAFFLGFVFVSFQPYIGIPLIALYFLAAFPCLLAVMDGYFYFFIQNKMNTPLKIIATANSLYSVFLS